MFMYDGLVTPKAQGNGRVGAAPLVSVVNAQQQFSHDASVALLQLFNGKYPQLTSSYTMAGGAQPAFDPNADMWGYIAASQAPEAGAQTVIEQLQSLQSGAVLLVDVATGQSAISGQPVNVVYGIAKSMSVAKALSGAGASLAMLDLDALKSAGVSAGGGPATSGGGGGGAGTAKFSVIPPIIGAGIGLLVAGPVGAAIGAGAGLVVELVRENQAKKAA